MTLKQRDKHNAEKFAVDEVGKFVEGSSLDVTPSSPDGLGAWKGGIVKGTANWVALKSRPTRTGDHKNTHGTNNHLGPKPITHRQDADFNEIHTDANGEFFLYNVKNDKWDIPTDAQTIPFYEDENGKLFAFNYKTGAWDVPCVSEDGEVIAEAVSANTPTA